MRTKLLITTLISLFFLYLFVYQVDLQGWLQGESTLWQALFGNTRINWSDLWTTLGDVDLRFLGGAVLLFVISVLIRTWRWQLLVRPVKPTGFHLLFAVLNIGYMANNLLPFRLGELIRAHLLGKEAGISRVSALATVIVERVLDMLGLLLLICLTLLLFRFPAGTIRADVTIGLGVMVLLLLILLLSSIFLRRTTRRLVFAVTEILSRRWRKKILKVTDAFLDGLEILRSAGHYFSLFSSSVLMWGCYLGISWLTFYAFGLNSSSYPQLQGNLILASLVVLTLSSIGMAIPSAPGAVGTYHASTQLALSFFAVPGRIAIPFAIILHLTSYIILCLFGFYYLWSMQLRLRDVRQDLRSNNRASSIETKKQRGMV